MQIRNYKGKKGFWLYLLSYNCQSIPVWKKMRSSSIERDNSAKVGYAWFCVILCTCDVRALENELVEVHRYAYAIGSLCALCIVVGMNRIMFQNVQISVWYLCNIYRDLQTDLYWHNNSSIIREKWQTVWQICVAGNAPLDNLNTQCSEFTKATQNNMCVSLSLSAYIQIY